MRIAYFVKRYPRYSETFIVNEILAHEKVGVAIDIFAMRPCLDTHFQDIIAKVRAPLHTVLAKNICADAFWRAANHAVFEGKDIWGKLGNLSNEKVGDVYQALMLVPELKKKKITHIHAHFANVAASVARCVNVLSGIPYSITAHAKDIFHESVTTDRLNLLFGATKKIVTVSDFNLQYLSNQHPDISDKFKRIYNGLDLDSFECNASQDRDLKIISVGRLVEKKGYKDLITAVRILNERGVRVQCEIIGSGEVATALQQQIQSEGVSDHVLLLGPKPQAEVKRMIQKSAVFAAPCVVGQDGNRDGLPTVLLEAMALGTPCIATDVTGIPEAIIDGKTGVIISQHSPSKLADAIHSLLKNKPRRETLARQARLLIEQLFNVRNSAALLRDEVFYTETHGEDSLC